MLKDNFYFKMSKDNVVGFFSGLLGGSSKLLLDATPVGFGLHSFIIKIIEAGFTALICGFLGVAGKHLFTVVKNWLDRIRKVEPKKTSSDEI